MHLYGGLTRKGAAEFLGCPSSWRVVVKRDYILRGSTVVFTATSKDIMKIKHAIVMQVEGLS